MERFILDVLYVYIYIYRIITRYDMSIYNGNYNDMILYDMTWHDKHPGGWETALAVAHVLKRNSSGAVAPHTFYDEHYLKFSRGKLNDFKGMSWYLQGFVAVAGWKPFPCSSLACHFSKRLLRASQSAACETEEVSGISMVPSPLPNPYSLKQLRVHSTIFTCAPRGWYCTFGNFSHSIDATGVH